MNNEINEKNHLCINRDKKRKKLQPRERFELSTPDLRDQCSYHWANEADTLVLKIDKTIMKWPL